MLLPLHAVEKSLKTSQVNLENQFIYFYVKDMYKRPIPIIKPLG